MYIDTGKGSRVVIFVHSYLWDKNMWTPQIDYLKDEYRCISINLNEQFNNCNLSFEKIAKKIANILDLLNVENYTYIGLSVGGMLAPYVYDLHKEKIKKMVLMDTYLGSESIETKTLYFGLLDLLECHQHFTENLIARVAPIFFSPNILKNNPKLLDDFKSYLRNIPQKNINFIVQLGRVIFGRESRLDFLSNVKIPLFFITGEFDIPRPYREAEEMHKMATKSEIYKITNAGHISNLENIAETNKLLEYILKIN